MLKSQWKAKEIEGVKSWYLESWITWATKSAGERPTFWRRGIQDWWMWGCFFIYVTYFFCLWNPVLEALCSCHIMGFPVTRLSDAINLLLPHRSSKLPAIHQTQSLSTMPCLFSLSLSLSLSLFQPSFQRAVALLESLLRNQSNVGGGRRVANCMVFPNIQEGRVLSVNKYSTARAAFWRNLPLRPVLGRKKRTWEEKQNGDRKRKEVLGAPPVSHLEFLQPSSAFHGSWKRGRGGWKKERGFY